MHKTRIAPLVVIILLCCLVAVNVALAEMFSDNYGVPWDARYGGAGLTSSDNYAINATVGQGVIGWTKSDNYGVGTGYWYGAVVEWEIYLPFVMRN
jgi:hypothetical protein